MARAGYDPREMASMFKTIEEQGGSVTAMLSDHPNLAIGTPKSPRRRSRCASRCEPQQRRLQSVQARLRQMSPARAPRTPRATPAGRRRSPTGTSGGRITGNVERPSSRYKAYTEGNLFRISVPSNWLELPGNNSVTFAPEGGYGAVNQQSVFTHGVEAGLTRNETHDLQTATNELVQSLGQSNPRMSRNSGSDAGRSEAGTAFARS